MTTPYCPTGYHLANSLQGPIQGGRRPSAWQMATATLAAGSSSTGSPAGMGWNIKHHRREEDEGTATTTTTTSNAPRATGTDWKQSQAVPAPSTTGGSRGTLPELPGNRDFPLPSSSSTGDSQEGQQQPPPPPPSSSPSAPQDNNNNNSDGTATTIGLSVGVTLAVVALILGAVLLVVRRRRRRRRRSSSTSSFSAGGERGEYPAGPPAPPPPVEMQQPQQHPQRWTELPAPLPRAMTRTRPCELPDGPYGRATAELDVGRQR
ncbi:hypothetical protein PG991_003824 [Apiospora marii]|uniref:Uncharacterized protein n=1 Tax=Apiospora marii TaxID=335849 RepID=A0ABR1S4J2_9PEZI